MGEMIYAPYDLTGVKFLWWTWHDTDAPVRERILGVPVGATVWVITFTASFQVIFLNYNSLIVIEGYPCVSCLLSCLGEFTRTEGGRISALCPGEYSLLACSV